MAFWSREIVLLVVIAVLASLAPANGFVSGRISTETQEGNKPAGGSVAFETSAGCQCDALPALACRCGSAFGGSVMGKSFSIEPEVNVEFIPSNVSFVMTVSNQNKTLYQHVISGEELIPPVCVTVPQFPFVGLCVSFKNLSADLEEKKVSFCANIGVKTTPVVPMMPTLPPMPVGCFSASPKDGIKYTPEIKFPIGEEAANFISNIPKLPNGFNNPFANGIKPPVLFGGPAVNLADKLGAQSVGDMSAVADKLGAQSVGDMSAVVGGMGANLNAMPTGWPFGSPVSAVEKADKLEAQSDGEMNAGVGGVEADLNAQVEVEA